MDQCCTDKKCLEAISKFNPDINAYLRFQLPDFSGPILDTCRTKVRSACMPMFTGPEATSTGPSADCWRAGGMDLMGYPEDAMMPQATSVPLQRKTSSNIAFHAPRFTDDSDSGRAENVRFDEIDKDGKFIRLFNDSECQDEELGCCIVRQAFKGHAIIEFHFPPRVFFPARNFVTIWARHKVQKKDEDEVIECCCCCCNFCFKELFRWAYGPDYLTTLVRPNGQIIATAKSSGFSTGKEEKQEGPAPRIISKFSLLHNSFRHEYEEKKCLAGPSSVAELKELLLKSRMSGRFKPRTTRRDGTEAAPKVDHSISSMSILFMVASLTVVSLDSLSRKNAFLLPPPQK